MNEPAYNPQDVTVGRVAIDHGLIDRELARRCLDTARASGVTFADAARQLGALTESRLALLMHLVREVTGGPPLRPLDASLQSSVSQLPKVGDALDGYRLTRLLGQGGMGAVFLGERGGERFAIKVILGEAGMNQVLRFEREAQAAARVGLHPHIVTIHGSGTAGGRPYIVFDFVDGQGLDERLKGGEPFAPEEAVALLKMVAEALAFTHLQGIIHRDLKPANILLRADGQPLVSDFGLARGTGFETLTRTGEMLGTPAYMAPEQIEGARPTPATDVWALGAILHEMLTGRRPFSGEGAVQVCTSIVTKEPDDPRSFGVPEGLARIIDVCLQKDPGARYPSARELADALAAWAHGQSVVYAAPSRRLKAARRLVKPAIVVLSCLGLVVGAVFGFQQLRGWSVDQAQLLSSMRDLLTREVWEAVKDPSAPKALDSATFEQLRELVSALKEAGAADRESAELDAVRDIILVLKDPRGATRAPKFAGAIALRGLAEERKDREAILAALGDLKLEAYPRLGAILWFVAARDLRCWEELQQAQPWRGVLREPGVAAAARQALVVAAWDDPDDARFEALREGLSSAAELGLTEAFAAHRAEGKTTLDLRRALLRLGPQVDAVAAHASVRGIEAALQVSERIASGGVIPDWDELCVAQDRLATAGYELRAPVERPWRDFKTLTDHPLYLDDARDRVTAVFRLLRLGVIPHRSLEVGFPDNLPLEALAGDRGQALVPLVASLPDAWVTRELEALAIATGETSDLRSQARGLERLVERLETFTERSEVAASIIGLAAFQRARYRDACARLRAVADALDETNDAYRDDRSGLAKRREIAAFRARDVIYSDAEVKAALVRDLDLARSAHNPWASELWAWFEPVLASTPRSELGDWVLRYASVPLTARDPDGALLEAAAELLGLDPEGLRPQLARRGVRLALAHAWSYGERERAFASLKSGAPVPGRPAISPLFFPSDREDRERTEIADRWIRSLEILGLRRLGVERARALRRLPDWTPPYADPETRSARDWRLACEVAPLEEVDSGELARRIQGRLEPEPPLREEERANVHQDLVAGGLTLLGRLDEAGAATLADAWREAIDRLRPLAPGGFAEADARVVSARIERGQSWAAFAYGARWLPESQRAAALEPARQAIGAAMARLDADRDDLVTRLDAEIEAKVREGVEPSVLAQLRAARDLRRDLELPGPEGLLSSASQEAVSQLIFALYARGFWQGFRQDQARWLDFARVIGPASPPELLLRHPRPPGRWPLRQVLEPLSATPGGIALAAAVVGGDIGLVRAWALAQLGAEERSISAALELLCVQARPSAPPQIQETLDRAGLALVEALLLDPRAQPLERARGAELALGIAARLGADPAPFERGFARAVALELIAGAEERPASALALEAQLTASRALRAALWSDSALGLALLSASQERGRRELAELLARSAPASRRGEPEVVAALGPAPSR